MPKKNIFRCLIKSELKKNNPIKYHELVINGSINSYLDYKEIEIKDLMNLIEKQLREIYTPPMNNNYYDYIKYENTIKYIAIEIAQNEIIL